MVEIERAVCERDGVATVLFLDESKPAISVEVRLGVAAGNTAQDMERAAAFLDATAANIRSIVALEHDQFSALLAAFLGLP